MYLSTKYLLVKSGKICHCTEKPSRWCLNQMIKVSIISNRATWSIWLDLKSLDRMQWGKKQDHWYNIIDQHELSESSHRRTSDKSRLRDILHSNWSVIVKKSSKIKELTVPNLRSLNKWQMQLINLNWMLLV